ncbi:MAG TPA: aldo/keto reductase [Phycisphaerae bacterium]|nr:aldo/keto reductase [Phycisphaerae bacterium]
MLYRRLGKTDLRVSAVGLGTWQFGGEWGKDFEQHEVSAMVDLAGELGINFIDTAECYGDHLSERLIGRALAGRREQFIIGSKFGHKFNDQFTRDNMFGPAEVLKQLEDSLIALETDYIDLYQFHSGSNDEFATEGLWEMLARQVEAGKIRHLGISISPATNIFQVQQADEVGAKAIQVVYNRLQQSCEESVFNFCEQHDLGLLARVPLASGFLSGKYNHESQFSETDVRSVCGDAESRREMIDKVLRLKETEVPEGVPMAQWALAWCLQHQAVTCVIPGCKNLQQVRSNAEAADLPMIPADHPQTL